MGGPGDGGWLASGSGERVSEQATEDSRPDDYYGTTTLALIPTSVAEKGHSRNNNASY